MKYMNFYKIKLKAGALQYTIFIAIVIALLVFAFISLSYTQQRFKLKASNFVQVIHNTNLAINYASTKQMPYNEVVEIKLQEEINENTTIENKQWGIFDLVIATSTIKNETFTKNAILGGALIDRPALYLQDNNQPLVVVGNTRIEGNTYLPKQAIKRGTIAGNSYGGSQLIYGGIDLSKQTLPQLKNRESLKQLSQGFFRFENAVPLALQEDIAILNSFNKPTQLYSSASAIDLQFVTLTGNIVIQSNTVIRVHPTAILKDVLLIAPKIEIYNNVTGNFQAFATKEISIGKNCILHYPSTLIVYEEKELNTSLNTNSRLDFNHIDIQSNTKVRGVIGFLSDNEKNNYKPQIIIDENTVIVGEVYCSQNIELKGTVKGSVFTKGFIANEYGSVYQNHIYNGNIISADFPKEFGGLNIENSTKSVSKWLY